MHVALVLASSVLLADITVPRGPHVSRDAIFTVATVHAVALVASAQCPGTLVVDDVNDLVAALGLSDDDQAAAAAEIPVFVKTFSEQADRAGAKAWCDEVYERFGPNGTMMPGLLKR